MSENNSHLYSQDNLKTAQGVSAAAGVAKGIYDVSDGIKEEDPEKIGKGMMEAGLGSALATPIAAPVVGSAAASIGGAAFGTAVGAAFFPITLSVGLVGGAIWLIGKHTK